MLTKIYKMARGNCPHCQKSQLLYIIILNNQELDTETNCFYCSKEFYINADTHKVTKKN